MAQMLVMAVEAAAACFEPAGESCCATLCRGMTVGLGRLSSEVVPEPDETAPPILWQQWSRRPNGSAARMSRQLHTAHRLAQPPASSGCLGRSWLQASSCQAHSSGHPQSKVRLLLWRGMLCPCTMTQIGGAMQPAGFADFRWST